MSRMIGVHKKWSAKAADLQKGARKAKIFGTPGLGHKNSFLCLYILLLVVSVVVLWVESK